MGDELISRTGALQRVKLLTPEGDCIEILYYFPKASEGHDQWQLYNAQTKNPTAIGFAEFLIISRHFYSMVKVQVGI